MHVLACYNNTLLTFVMKITSQISYYNRNKVVCENQSEVNGEYLLL